MKKIYLGMIMILAVLYAVRFWYVNSLFPQEEYISTGMHEIITNHGLEYRVENLELISAEEYAESYGNTDTFDAGETVAVTTLKVQNTSSKIKRTNLLDFVLTKGSWSNGTDLYSLYDMNGDTFDGTIQPGEVQELRIATCVNAEVAKLHAGKEPWILRLSGWPYRKEFVVSPENAGD